MNVLTKIKKAITKSDTKSSEGRRIGKGVKDFKLQLLNLRLYSEEVDSLFCVTVVSGHLVCPKKGHPVTVLIDQNNLQVIWADPQNKLHVLCSHPLHSITYQFHTSFKPRLYGYTALWGVKKICLLFEAPWFSRTKGLKISQCYDKMLQHHHYDYRLLKGHEGNSDCSNQHLAGGRKDTEPLNTRSRSRRPRNTSLLRKTK